MGDSLEAGERSALRGSFRQDQESASLPTRVFNAVSSPSFSAAQNSLRLPNCGSAPGSSNMLRRPISSGSASLEGRLGKANRHDLRSPATNENSRFSNAIYRHAAVFKVNPPWSLRPFPDLFSSQSTQNGRDSTPFIFQLRFRVNF